MWLWTAIFMFRGMVAGSSLRVGKAGADFNGDGFPDYLLYNASIGGTFGICATMIVSGRFRADYFRGMDSGGAAVSQNGHLTSCCLIDSLATVLWYEQQYSCFRDHGPDLPAGWNVAGVADFNGDGFPDYLLYNANIGGTHLVSAQQRSYRDGVGPTIPGDGLWWELRISTRTVTLTSCCLIQQPRDRDMV